MPRYSTTRWTYLGYPVLEVLADGKRWIDVFDWDEHFQFGQAKARMILAAWDAIELFVATEGASPPHFSESVRQRALHGIVLTSVCTTFPSFEICGRLIERPYMKVAYRQKAIGFGVTKAAALIDLATEVEEFALETTGTSVEPIRPVPVPLRAVPARPDSHRRTRDVVGEVSRIDRTFLGRSGQFRALARRQQDEVERVLETRRSLVTVVTETGDEFVAFVDLERFPIQVRDLVEMRIKAMRLLNAPVFVLTKLVSLS